MYEQAAEQAAEYDQQACEYGWFGMSREYVNSHEHILDIGQGHAVFCHSRERGNPPTVQTHMDSRVRGNDRCVLPFPIALFLEN